MSNVTAKQLLRALKSLESWTDKILPGFHDGESVAYGEQNDFIDYWKYYKEMVPYISQFARETDNAEIKRLSARLCGAHIANVEDAMRPRGGRGLFGIFSSSDDPLPEQYRGEVRLYLQQMSDDLRNLVYQLELMD